MDADSSRFGDSINGSHVQRVHHGYVEQVSLSSQRDRSRIAEQVFRAEGDDRRVGIDFEEIDIRDLADIRQYHPRFRRFEGADIYQNLTQECIASLLKLQGLIYLVLRYESKGNKQLTQAG